MNFKRTLLLFSRIILALLCMLTATTQSAPAQVDNATADQHLALAQAAFSRRDYKSAYVEINRALAIRKEDPAAEMLLATIYHADLKRDKALKAISDAIKHQPNYPQ